MARWLSTSVQNAFQIPAIQQLVAQPAADTSQSRGRQTRQFTTSVESGKKAVCPASSQVKFSGYFLNYRSKSQTHTQTSLWKWQKLLSTLFYNYLFLSVIHFSHGRVTIRQRCRPATKPGWVGPVGSCQLRRRPALNSWGQTVPAACNLIYRSSNTRLFI